MFPIQEAFWLRTEDFSKKYPFRHDAFALHCMECREEFYPDRGKDEKPDHANRDGHLGMARLQTCSITALEEGFKAYETATDTIDLLPDDANF